MHNGIPLQAQLERNSLWLFLLIGVVGCQSNSTPILSPSPFTPATIPLITATATTAANNTTVANVQAESADTVIRLSWESVPGALGYFIYRDGQSTPLNPSFITETHFEDLGLTNGRAYTYTIAAVGQDGRAGPRSVPITATPKSH